MEQKTDTAPNINGYSESRPLCICIQFGGMSGERVRRRAEGGMIVSPFTAHYRLSLSLLFDYEWMPFGHWQLIICQHWCWTQRMRFSCENVSEQKQLLKALMRTRTSRFIINLLTSRYETEIDVLQWRMKCNCSTVCHFSFFKKQILQELTTYFSMHYCQLNHWKCRQNLGRTCKIRRN